jgi:tetratricopeptide (TPR) repeat protein
MLPRDDASPECIGPDGAGPEGRSPECVSAADLRAFLTGELADPIARLVTEHLERCAACEAAARRLDAVDDSVIARVRRAVRPGAPVPTVMETCDDTAPATADTEKQPPARQVGRYTILGELGRGGMAIVYRAQQAHPARQVAVKVLLGGTHSAAERKARFLAEADALARLRHPNIVQVFEVGEQEGAPFLALELVEGGNLAEWLGGRPLAPDIAAGLTETLAGAVQHAHEQGIIHRDLKPSNVLLQKAGAPHRDSTADSYLLKSDWCPKISDFGLAKHERPGLTATGAILGTPSYMSPEQAAGDTGAVGPSADIYALGAILYELLTGRPPFAGATALEILEQVRTEEPVPPSRLLPRIPRDLGIICLKCLHKQPGRRYATARALAEDLRRLQAGEPIQARPTPAHERAVKWARRSPAKATLAAGSVVAVIALVAGILWHNSKLGAALTLAQNNEKQAGDNLQIALQQQQQAELARGKARARFLKARQAVDEMLTEVGDKNLAQIPYMVPLRKTLLEKALVFNEEFLRDSADDADLRVEVALAHKRAGDVNDMLGDLKQACANLRQATDRFAPLAREFPDNAELRIQLAHCWARLAEVCREMSANADAEQAIHQALAAQTQLTEAFPTNNRLKWRLAGYRNNLGVILGEVGKPKEAEECHRQALAIMEELIVAKPDDREFRRELANCCNHVALYTESKRAFAQAEILYRRALVIQEQLVTEMPYYPFYRQDIAGSWLNLANVLTRMRQSADALAAYEKAVAYQKRLVNEFASVPRFQQDLALILANLGLFQHHAEKLDDAERTFREAMSVSGKLIAAYPGIYSYQSRHGGSCNNLAMVLLKKQQLAEARSCLEQAVKHQTIAFEGNPRSTQYRSFLRNHYGLLAETCLRLRDPQAAAQVAVKLPELMPAGHTQWLLAASYLARCVPLAEEAPNVASQQRKAQAQALADRAMDHLQKAVQHGFTNVDVLKSDPALSSIRPRDDFRRLVESLSMR